MADEHSQRPYRASEPPLRGSAKSQGTDPLAELARLIGQTDPFGEFGRETARRASAPPPAERADWDAPPVNSPYAPRAGADYRSAPTTPNYAGNGAQNYGREDYGRQPYSDPPVTDDPYAAEHEAHGYLPGQADYQQEGYDYDPAHQAGEEYYDDAPPSRWRLGVVAVVSVLALAVIGTAGAFGYRALFGSSGSSQPPPVIKADAGPSKVVPATTGKDTQSGKLITDRVNDRGQSEKLVSREEQPIDRPATAMLTPSAPQAVLGSGVVSNEPKKVRTIAIHPDQPVGADAQAPAPPLAAAASSRTAPPAATARPAPPPPPARAAADTSTADAEQNAPAPPTAARPAPAARQAAPASSNTPLSLSPDVAPTRPAAAATRTASVAAPAAMAPAAPAAASSGSPGSGSFVQVSSQRSEAEAQAAFRDLQAKYPNQLGGRQPVIYRVDLGAKGTYYRTMVGPFASSGAAGDLCSSLKAAGGQCLIQRN
jgi:SPOR domain